MLTANAPASRRSSCRAAWRLTANPTSGGSSESGTRESTVSPAACPATSTVTTRPVTEPLGRGLGARRRPRADLRSAAPPLAVTALRVREDRALLLVRELVELRRRTGRAPLPCQNRIGVTPGPITVARYSVALPDRPVAVRVEAVTEGAASRDASETRSRASSRGRSASRTCRRRRCGPSCRAASRTSSP